VTDDRLARQMAFIMELDKLKSVLRRTTLMDQSRQENSAEHSWHLGLMAMLLAEHADEPVDVAKVVKMVLVHDVVEIDAGDTFCYDANGVLDQVEREERAATRLFGLLPAEQAMELRSLWEEFDARESAEARFATALDHLQPVLNNFHSGGGTWVAHGITLEQVQTRMAPLAESSTSLAAYAGEIVAEALARGYVKA